MNELTSQGKCLFCDIIFDIKDITRHLHNHLKQKAPENPGKKGKSYLVTAGSGPYFLQLWIDGDSELYILDDFLRGIWVECCDHLSAFFINRHDEIDMEEKGSNVFHKGLKLMYEYDFGTTTRLEIKVVNEYPMPANESIVLLSRNEPLKILCNKCGKKPAEVICPDHIYRGEGYYCMNCGKKHEKECEYFSAEED